MKLDRSESMRKYIGYFVKTLVATVIIADAIARPIYRPVINWTASWKLTEALERRIERMPRLAILILFAIPFIIAEPLKVLALLMIASGGALIGIPLLALSYLVTFVLVERIYHAGKPKLLTYKWFAKSMEYVGMIREYVKSLKQNVIERMSAFLAWLV